MLNSMKGYDLKVEDWSFWNWPKTVVKNNDWQWLWSEGVRSGLFRYGHLYKGSIEGIRALNKIGDVIIITHRPRNAVQDTLDWLAYQRLPFMEVNLLTNGEPKSSVPHCDLYVDDKPENIVDFLTNVPEATSLLWTRPWNAEKSAAEFERVTSWEEVFDQAAAIRNQG
jgi:5'(3')-deoxyribonucleotidase